MFGVICRRNWALRLSIVLNVCVLLYVCAHFGAVSGPWIEEGAAAGASNWAANPNSIGASSVQDAQILQQEGTQPRANATAASTSTAAASGEVKTAAAQLDGKLEAGKLEKTGSNAVDFKGNETKLVESNAVEEKKVNQTVNQNKAKKELTLQEAVLCNDKSSEPKTAQRGDYWVLYNYVPMSMKVHCWESVTYTTHADYTFLDNLEPLLDRWRAPISIALHAPGADFPPTIEAIKYARSCGSPLVAQLVTFHVYFSSKHVPKMIPSGEKVASERANCSKPAPWVNVNAASMYKNYRKLLYPVNVGRNVARESAPTRYVLASDIELYPSPDLPAKFLEMIRRNDQPALLKPNPKVFVLSIFEVDEKSQPPANKTRLMQMLKAGTAIPFHKKLCAGCHNVPRSKEWQEAPETSGLHIFHTGKRTGSFIHWEPIYIGTNDDPLYDERLSWEGKSDKMTQGYALCVLDYDFLIVDNAFLVHRPGIKVFKKDNYRDTLTAKTNVLIKKIIVPELKVLYGTRKGCAV
ncbi:beta-1,4-glucuronyltransferase 1 isoform X2 [Nasonia vitripennis]|uniref:N-acetyllactosaminide beta-1,3-N-acetylglucosaminyltransferase n=1 Tax=Nasonia vitripennis TaxID=7425 RepID=A0A7M7HBF6_NASVI|nr:beta-1,4-glucuronyltransferase 1 isoform X2 [Nasonia vitripennis]